MAREEKRRATTLGFQLKATLEQKPKPVKRTRSLDSKDLEGHDEEPRATPSRGLVKNAVLPQEIQPKADESLLQRWETQYEEFLEAEEFSRQDSQLPDDLTLRDDTETFLASFEQVAVSCRWPRREWVTRLLPALSEEAEKAFDNLDAKDRSDFQKVKAAILRCENLRRDRKRQQFRRFCYQEASGPQDIYAQLQELCHQWLNAEKSSKERILELVILEQFFNVLPKEMQSWVRNQCPETCGQAVSMAEDFLRLLQTSKGPKQQQEPVNAVAGFPAGADVPLRKEPSQALAKKETDKYDTPPTQLLPSYRQANMGRGMNRKRRRSEPAELHVRFPGKANRIFPHRWKQERAVKERRRSERLRGTYPVASVDVPVPCKVVYKKFGRGGLPQKSPMDLPPKNRLKVCPECGRSFNGIASLLRHRMHHTGEKRYECCFCGKGFCWRSDLSRHECIHTGKMPHECPFCGEGFDRKWKREAHQQMHMKSLALKDTESEKKY